MAAESDESANDSSALNSALMDAANSQNSPQNDCSRIFPCRFEGCNSIFTKRSHLDRHELIHNDIRPFSCSQDGCGKSFRTKCHLKRHESSHSGEKSFKCEYEDCNVACYNAWSLKRHIKRTHEGTFKCGKCDKEFKKNKMLQDHISIDHKRSVVVCTFPGCTHIFKNQAKMKFHQKLHSGKGYTCPVKGCSEAFALFSECRKHSAECKRKEVKCDVCEKVFKSRSNLKAHQKTHESEREVFQCHYPECKRFYTKKYNLQAHIQSFHQNIQQFECPKPNCNKKFHYKHSLRHHLNNHGKIDGKQSCNKPKRKRPKRMVTSDIAGITGYIPELMYKLTPAEMNEYVNGCDYDPECLADTDIIPKDYETTQAEMTALSSGNFSCLKTTENEDDIPRFEEEKMNIAPDFSKMHQDTEVHDNESTELVSGASEETVTASLSADELIVLEPSTMEEIANIFNQQFTQHASSSSLSSSVANSPIPTRYDSNEMSKLNERLQQLARNHKLKECNVVLEKSCSMQQSVAVKGDSDSSDNERVLIHQIV